MELPVENRDYAIRRIVVILILIVTISTVLLFKSYSQNTLYLVIVFLGVDLFFSFRFFIKHNIQKILLTDDNLRVFYKGEKIIVSFNEIDEIHSGLNDYIELSGKSSIMYRIDLKRKYKFGNQLYFKYNVKDIPDKEPKEMITIKNRVKQSSE
jgi:hypothetical protein